MAVVVSSGGAATMTRNRGRQWMGEKERKKKVSRSFARSLRRGIIRFEQVCELGPNELLFFFVIGYLPRSKYGPLMYATVMGGRTPHHEVMTAGDTTTGTTILPTTPPPPLLLDPSNRRSATRSESKDLYHRPNTTTVRDSLRGNAPLRCDFNTIELPWWW